MSELADALIYFADIALSKLVVLPGGKQRDEAIAEAQVRIESLRDECIDGIEEALRDAESVLNVVQDANVVQEATLDKQQLLQVRELADRIITLAGTFGYDRLGHVARSLGDLTNMLLILGAGPADPIIVHIRSAWLFTPRAAVPPADNAQKVLAELGRVLAHFGILASTDDAELQAGDEPRPPRLSN